MCKQLCIVSAGKAQWPYIHEVDRVNRCSNMAISETLGFDPLASHSTTVTDPHSISHPARTRGPDWARTVVHESFEERGTVRVHQDVVTLFTLSARPSIARRLNSSPRRR